MDKVIREGAIRVGVDLAKRAIPVHAVDAAGRLVVALRERSGWQKAVAALANKNARILWGVMTRGEAFDANHLSVKPGAASGPPSEPTTNFLARREDEDALDRSDRQPASSTNPWWRLMGSDHVMGLEPR